MLNNVIPSWMITTEKSFQDYQAGKIDAGHHYQSLKTAGAPDHVLRLWWAKAQEWKEGDHD